jgi:Zn-dependent peptidase ImmA (M78 family)
MGVESVHEADMAEDGRLEQDGTRAVIYLRYGLSRGRRRFTLAHELAHRALLHPSAPAIAYRRIGDNDDEERLCDEIAAAVLMPHAWMLTLSPRPQNLSTLRLISERGQVSLSAALVRSREVNHWRKSLLRFSFDQDKWRLQGASGVPAEWHRSIRSARSTHGVLEELPIRRDTQTRLPLRAGDHEVASAAQIDRSRGSAIALAALDQQLSLLPGP